jgi:inhibitor of cysteine peptidase
LSLLESADPTILTEEDDGRTVWLAKGGLLTIQVQGNRTSGYRWEAKVGDATVLSETRPPAFSPSSSAPGAGGTYEFSFTAGGAGQARLTLAYRRSWEADVPPARTFEISVEVR